MNAKFLLAFTLVLLATFVAENEAFTAGGGGNLPYSGKRDLAKSHQLAGRALCKAAREHCKREFVLEDINE